MKYILILLSLHLLAVVAGAQTTPKYYYGYPYFDTLRPQQSNYVKWDSIGLESFDTNSLKRYRDIFAKWIAKFPDTAYRVFDISGAYSDKSILDPTSLWQFAWGVKCDTIGGWHLVSSIRKGKRNLTHAAYLYEVIIRSREYDSPFMWSKPRIWLDSNKKPFKLQVWQ